MRQPPPYTSLDLTVKFLRPITMDTGRVRAIGTVLNAGRRIALAQAQLVDAAGRLLAHATSSCGLFAATAYHRRRGTKRPSRYRPMRRGSEGARAPPWLRESHRYACDDQGLDQGLVLVSDGQYGFDVLTGPASTFRSR